MKEARAKDLARVNELLKKEQADHVSTGAQLWSFITQVHGNLCCACLRQTYYKNLTKSLQQERKGRTMTFEQAEAAFAAKEREFMLERVGCTDSLHVSSTLQNRICACTNDVQCWWLCFFSILQARLKLELWKRDETGRRLQTDVDEVVTFFLHTVQT